MSDYLTAFVIQFLFTFVSDWGVLASVDVVIRSVTFSDKTILIIAYSLALIGTIFDNKKEKLGKSTE